MLRPGSPTAIRDAGETRAALALWAEYDAAIARAQTPATRIWRERMGWPRRAALMGLGGGVSRILPHVGGLFTPCEDGSAAAIIIPAWLGPAPGRPGDLYDLIAWVPTSGSIYTRRGLADILGDWAIIQAEPCMGIPGRIEIFPDPGAWARAATWDDQGGHGVVVLDWNRARARLGHLAGVCDFVCPDIGTGQRLRRALQPSPEPKAHILIQQTDRGAA